MKIKITTGALAPAGKLADAEIHFTDGPLAGLRLIGFSIWERRGSNGLNVTFPARQYSVNGERRSFALLRPTDYSDGAGQDRIRQAVIDAYRAEINGTTTDADGFTWAPDTAPPADATPAQAAAWRPLPQGGWTTDQAAPAPASSPAPRAALDSTTTTDDRF